MKWFLVALLFVSPAVFAERCEPGPKQLFWGDLHIHTSFSMDAYVWNNQVTPAQALEFAQGHVQIASNGQQLKLDRALDFAAVTDHAEYFAVIEACQVQQADTAYCRALREAAAEDSRRGFNDLFLPALLAGDRLCQVPGADCVVQAKSLWQRTIDAANEATQPCEFTAFVANEWTASPDNLHWHRNLIYANDTVPERAINSFDEPDQLALWQALAERCGDVPDCDVLAIPHNSNIGLGGAFDVSGHSAAQLGARSRFEKLVEIHQHKGSSECYPGSTLSDEDCEFEIMLPIPMLRALQANPRDLTEAEQQQVASGYVRDVLAKGLQIKQQQGLNPFVYGFVGATDTHSGRPGAVTEDNWSGAIGTYDLSVERLQTFTHYNPGGLTAVWARANTREEVFAALQRRETYASSGPRIGLKFGVASRAYGCAALERYAPMGSTYSGRASPHFVVHAQQDKVALQQVDIVRLTLDEGNIEQQVISWRTKKSGEADWCVTWQDPGYDRKVPTAWYARVLQAPTARWDGKKQIRERAWSSPVWSAAALP